MAAIDSALWDIFGKRAGTPVYNFFGGKVRPSLPMFAGVGGANLQQQEENARQAMENGYKHLRCAAVGKRGNQNAGGGGGRGRGAGPGGAAPADGPGNPTGSGRGGAGAGPENFGERGPVYANRPMEIRYITNLVESMEHLRNTVGWHVNLLCEADARMTPANGLVLSKALETSGCSGSKKPSVPRTSRGTSSCAR